ncbi:MAG: hypothetical protein HY731_10165 [Candidatus Tectomicrobia bacterium]|nr:hypothetical protein [Candidatus Tectomicrobia bacterium]
MNQDKNREHDIKEYMLQVIKARGFSMSDQRVGELEVRLQEYFEWAERLNEVDVRDSAPASFFPVTPFRERGSHE